MVGVAFTKKSHKAQNTRAQAAGFLHTYVADMIDHWGEWIVPDIIQNNAAVLAKLQQVIYSPQAGPDRLVWTQSVDGKLSSKEASNYLKHPANKVPWSKFLWNVFIPPSRAFIFWRWIHDKMPTDDNLMRRGCTWVSICSFCCVSDDTSNHIFLHCSFVQILWNWLSDIFNCQLNFSSASTILNSRNNSWSSQTQDLFTAAIIHTVWVTWKARNDMRFNNVIMNVHRAKTIIFSAISESGNLSKGIVSPSMFDFSITRKFNVKGNYGKAPKIIEVIWRTPIINWLKVNTDGSVFGEPKQAACGGIFRDFTADFAGCFASNIGNMDCFAAEIVGILTAIELAHARGWFSLWLESDSTTALMAFSSPDIVPWRLRNRWLNCIEKTKQMNFKYSHIFREGNSCADKLANFGHSIVDLIWWEANDMPSFISYDFNKDRLCLPSYRFS